MPLVQVLFVLQNTPESEEEVSGITFESIKEESISTRFDLALFMHEDAQGIGGSVLYRAELFKEQTITLLTRRLEILLTNAVITPDTSVNELEIYTDEEKAKKMIYEENLYTSDRKSLLRRKSKVTDSSESHPMPLQSENEQ